MLPFGTTRAGWGVNMLIVLIGGAALNTGTNLLYLMFAGLIGLWVATLALFRFNLAGLAPSRSLPLEIYAGKEFEIHYELANRKRRAASYAVGIEEEIRPAPGWEGPRPVPVAAFAVAVPPARRETVRARATWPARGPIEFRATRLVSVFPFGLFECRLRREIPARALVYPALADVDALIEKAALDLGDRESPAKGRGGSLYSIREYAPGDPARSIHWKLSSKGTGVKIREYEREDARRVRVVLDPRLPARPSAEDLAAFERHLSVAASLAARFVEWGFEVAVWSAAGEVPSGSGPSQLRAILRSLAVVRSESFAGVAAHPPPSEGAADVWISPKSVDGDSDGGETRPLPKGARAVLDPALAGGNR